MSDSYRHRRGAKASRIEAVAGNGILDHRALLGRGVVYAGAISTGAPGSFAAAAEPAPEDVLDHQVACRRWQELFPEARDARRPYRGIYLKYPALWSKLPHPRS